jgi:hypothetical protein
MTGEGIRHWIRIAGAAALLGVLLAGAVGWPALAQPTASGGQTSYYVSLTGRDANPGTRSAPFRTFAKATSVLQAGDSLYIFGGTYHQALKISKSGAPGSPIQVQPVSGASVVIDLQNRSSNNVSLTGSYVVVKGLEVINSNGFCVNLRGTHNTIQGSRVHECFDMGIYTDGQNETIRGNTVYHASLKNKGFSMTGGWASGIKVRVGGNHILIVGNRTHHNYGEGIAVSRGRNVTVRNNISYDNHSVNIYIDNSSNVLVARNFTYSHPNNGFGANGIGCENIGIGEEHYSGWGAQLSKVTIVNNIAYNGSHGVAFFGNSSGTPGGGLRDSTIAFNTLWGSINSEIYIVYDTAQSGNLIANNIVQQDSKKLILLPNASGIILSHNFWVNGLPPLYARGEGDRTGNVQLASEPGYTAGSFRLSSASAAINAGSTVPSVVDDYAGAPRPSGPANDIGAYENSADPGQ